MKNYSFAKFAEWADFGFKLGPQQRPKNEPSDGPIKPLDVEYVARSLQRLASPVHSEERFFGEIQWGESAGAVRLQFTPLGGLKAMVRKLCTDLLGENRWICKRVVEIRHLFDENPDLLTSSLDKVVNEVVSEGVNAPQGDYQGLESLTMAIASKLRGARSDLFFFNGIKRNAENVLYNIKFAVNGMGVQRQGQKRVEELVFEVAYHRDSGVIQIICQEIISPLGQHTWSMDEAQWNEIYMPSQSVEEIVETQYHLFRSY